MKTSPKDFYATLKTKTVLKFLNPFPSNVPI